MQAFHGFLVVWVCCIINHTSLHGVQRFLCRGNHSACLKINVELFQFVSLINIVPKTTNGFPDQENHKHNIQLYGVLFLRPCQTRK